MAPSVFHFQALLSLSVGSFNPQPQPSFHSAIPLYVQLMLLLRKMAENQQIYSYLPHAC